MSTTIPPGPAIIVDPYSSGNFYAPAFSERGRQVWALLTDRQPPDVYSSSFRPNDFHNVLIAPDWNIATLIRHLQDSNPLCILAGCESGVELADKLAPHVVPEFSNLPEHASARRHKGSMADAVRAVGLQAIPHICSSEEDEIAEWIELNELADSDLVLKPPKSVSTDNVTRVPSGGDWRAVFRTIIDHPNKLGIINDTVIVQPYITGTEYVVDTVSYNGVHGVVDICRYNKINNGPFMAVYESMEWMPSMFEHCTELLSYAFGVLDAVGVINGPAHIEIMMTDRGPLLIEIAARPHGGGQPRSCRLAVGDNQIDRTASSLLAGRLVKSDYELVNYVFIVFFISTKTQRVTHSRAMDRLKLLDSHCYSFVNFKDGELIPQTGDLFSSLSMGHAVLVHPDRRQLLRDRAAIRVMESKIFEPPI